MIETQRQEGLELWQEDIVQEYYTNNAKKLYQMVDRILLKYGGITDHDEFYVLATDLFLLCIKKFDRDKGNFEGFFYSVLSRKIITAIRDKNRAIRSNTKQVIGEDKKIHYEFNPDISISTPIGDGGNTTLEDTIEDDKVKEESSSNVENYLASLSKTQKKIADMVIKKFSIQEIREELNISEVKFKKILSGMKSFDKKIILKHSDVTVEEAISMQQTQTKERSKETQYSVSSLIKKINGYTFRFDHPTQREKGRWTSLMKGNLISDILQDNPLPHLIFAEQIIDGVAVTWNLDGKQKSTNAYDFYNNEFTINKNVRRGDIEYQTERLDEDGKIITNNNIPVFETKTFDIRKKKFKDLPKELQERFCDYTFQCTQYLNCSDEDIEYHICRYNEGVRLNGSEKGMGEIGTKYAATIKEIASMPFFSERGGYKVSEFNNGTVNRVIAESIMAVNYLNEWRKKPEEICAFMKDKVNEEIFDDFSDMVERLDKVTTDNVCEMFNSKDSFLYFGLFARFCNTGEPDERFIEFMTEFSTQSLHKKEISGVTFDRLCVNKDGKSASNKDKLVAIGKIDMLEKLMRDYLHISIEETQLEEPKTEEISTLDFVRENVGQDIKQENIEFYREDFNLYSLYVNNTSILMDKNNRPSFLALIAYGYKKDRQLDEWFVDYFNRNNTYIHNQKENYIKMRDDLEKYISEKEKVPA